MTTPLRINPLKILLADDNDANRLIARTILERSGHTVTTAEHGLHAISLAKETHYDLIILDIMMPVMDGMRAMRQLKRSEVINQNTPIFALTAYCSEGDRQRYFLAGFDSVLSKPLGPGDLEAAYLSYKDNSPPAIKKIKIEKSGAESTPLLDQDMIRQLSEAADPTRLLTIQSRFWKSIKDKCIVMQKTLPQAIRGEGADLSEFRKAVHAVKGASAAIGLARVSHISSRLQNAPPSDITALMRDWAEALTESKLALSKALSGTRQLDSSVQMCRQDQSEAAHDSQNHRTAV